MDEWNQVLPCPPSAYEYEEEVLSDILALREAAGVEIVPEQQTRLVAHWRDFRRQNPWPARPRVPLVFKLS